MLRLCTESSRSYTPQGGTELSPGRPVRLAVFRKRSCVQHGNMQDDRAGVSRGHSRQRTPPLMTVWWLGTSPAQGAGMDSPCRRAELEEGVTGFMSSESR
jgi:hypothetical protein